MAMRLRELKWMQLPVWPPDWMISDQGLGEEGNLEDVQLRKDLTPGFIGVTVNYLDGRRFGIIILENPTHLEILYHKLKENLGRTLTEIGDLEIDFTPAPSKYGLKQSRPRPSANYPKRMVNKK
jgi:hypothetical protein